MSRLVVVSNRVAVPQEPRAGGLAAAMDAALKERGGLWFGWSGKLVAANQRALQRQTLGNVDYALLDLSREEYDAYYLGFANRTLWPLLHFQPGKMRYSRAEYAVYRAVNRLFAARLAPLLRDDDRVWIHDYHLLPLAAELRALGVGARLGFFLHIPLPPPELLINLPCHADLLACLPAFDLIGLQSADDAKALSDYFRDYQPALTLTPDGVMQGTHHARIGVFPISIDTVGVARLAREAMGKPAVRKLRVSLEHRKLAIGVDRLDYSKGLPQRFEAFGRFLAEHPRWRAQVSYLQIAPASREGVPEYRELRASLERIAGATNGRWAEPEWVPIRYVNRSFTQATLVGFYRIAQIGLVTPLRDGMNLVAKEYIAAQAPDNPGALVLSCFAGAAGELQQAIVVNPFDPEGMVEGIEQALTMPQAERRERWHAMYAHLLIHDIGAWRRAFLTALGH